MLFLLLACRSPCPTWDELELVNVDGASDAVVATTRAAIDEVAAWSGREGLCVSEVRLQDEVVSRDGERFGGRYHPEGWIELEIDGDITTAARHELCHAADHQAGWISEDHPELFGADDPHEVLAYLCDDGPRDLTLAVALSASCDADFDAPLRFIDQTVYPAAAVEDGDPPGTAALSLDRRGVEGLPERWDRLPVFASGRLWALGESDDDARPVALWIDPETARATALDLPDGLDGGVFAESPDRVLLVGAGRAAWYDQPEARWTDAPFPSFDAVSDAALLGDEGWVIGRRDGGDTALFRVDLASATADLVAEAEGVVRIRLDGDGLLAHAHEQEGWFWLRFSRATGLWTREQDPDGWRALDRLTLADGRELATWELYAAGSFDVAGLAVRRPGAGDWWLADDPCGADELALSHELLSLDGEAWLWELSSGQDTLTRVRVE